jgi:predicted RNA-binding Zn ribbon-like protein
MPTIPIPHSISPELPLKYVGGDPSIDLVNTVDWRSDGLDHDRIPTYGRLTEWAEGAGVVTPAVAGQLRRLAAEQPKRAAATLADAARLRWILQRVFSEAANGDRPGEALDDLNDLLAGTMHRIRVTSAGRQGLRLSWAGFGDELDSLLWPVIWSAAQLLTSDEVTRIHACAAPDCGWMYVDRSRNGLRRWCQMETCGTRAKSRRRYQKRAG